MIGNKKSFTMPLVSSEGLKKFTLVNMVLMTAGLFIEKTMLTGSGTTFEQLKNAFASDADLAGLVLTSLLLQLIGGMCVPVFAYLTVIGFSGTSRLDVYVVRVAAAAIVAEPFFDLFMSGSVISLDSQNPAFTVVLILFMLYIMKFAGERVKKGAVVVQILLAACGVVWAVLLRLYCGLTMVTLASIFYIFRNKNGLKTLLGMPVSVFGGLIGQGSFLSIFAFYGVYFYNVKERREGFNGRFFYIAYVGIIIVCGIAAVIHAAM